MFESLCFTTANVSVNPILIVPQIQAVDLSAPFSLFVSPVIVPYSASALARVPLDIAHHFAKVPDPRHPAFRDYHLLSDILVISLSAVISGCKSWEAIADFGRVKHDWFRSIGLTLPNGAPSHDTISRIFAAMNPLAFQHAFTAWINAVCERLHGVTVRSHIPIDGKSARGSRGPDGTCLHLVSAWAYEHRLTLAQIAVEDKSNEITAIPKLLKMLDLRGALVSIDAMGCQKTIAEEIRLGEGHYLLGLKDNQPTLAADVHLCFENAFACDFEGVSHDIFVTEEINHGRYEERVFTVISQPEGLSTQAEWKDLETVVQVVRTRRDGDKETITTTYFISSSRAPAKELAEGIRDHWSIENNQHWVLDVVFGEDRCRTRNGNAPENLAWLRKMVLSLFNRDEDSTGTVPTRQIRAAADDEYRLRLLNLFGVKYA